MFWGSIKNTYKYRIVMSLNCDPSNIVHDIHGEFTLEDGETTDDGRQKIIEQYISENRIRHAHPVQILTFTCK